MVEKLNDIIKDRYGKGFSIQRLSGVDELSTTEAIVRGDDLYIPIVVKDLFLGFGRIHQAADLSSDQKIHASKLVKMILEPALYSQHLEASLQNLEAMRADQDYASDTRSKSLLIWGQSPYRIQKICLSLHEVSENWSYLPFADIQHNILSASDLIGLEGTTLVVNLNERVSFEKQTLIFQYLKAQQKGALLLFVSSKPARLLLDMGHLEENLTDILAVCEFSADRLPLDQAALHEALEMLDFRS